MAKYLFTFKGNSGKGEPESDNDYEWELYRLSGCICEVYINDARPGANTLEAYFEMGDYTVFPEELTPIDEDSLPYKLYTALKDNFGENGYLSAENLIENEPLNAIALLLKRLKDKEN